MANHGSASQNQHTTEGTENTRAAQKAKRTRGEDAAPAPGHRIDNIPRNYRDVLGWGADLDPKNRPMVPMELPSTVKTVRGDVKRWQKPPHKIHMSNEQPGLTPVFGTTCAPHGLSGRIRDYAYQYGEGTNRHWMTLVLADRVDMLEHLIGDAARGHPDNYVREKGWAATMKYDRKRRTEASIFGAVAIGALAIGLAMFANGRR